MNKNYPKYYSYCSAIEQIDAAISARFFLEAITIEESIITDRLYRFCKDHGMKSLADRITLGGEIFFIDKNSHLLSEHGIDFMEEIKQFWTNRNRCLHQIAKSEPGTPTQDFTEIYTIAEQSATDGKIIVKKVSNWAARYKRGIFKTKEEK